MAVALATLSTNLWDTMYNHLQTGTYAITTNNIFSSFNDQLIKDKGFPIVVVRMPEYSLKEVDFGSEITRAEVTFYIEVYHKTAQSTKSTADEIVNKIRTGYTVFEAVGLKKIRDNWFESIAYDSWQVTPNHRVHKYVMAINFGWTNG